MAPRKSRDARPRKNAGTVTRRKVKELERERSRRAHYETAAGKAMCWNCYCFDHHYRQCPQGLKEFCRKCGTYGKIEATCPRYREGGYRSFIAERKKKQDN